MYDVYNPTQIYYASPTIADLNDVELELNQAKAKKLKFEEYCHDISQNPKQYALEITELKRQLADSQKELNEMKEGRDRDKGV